MTLELLLLGKSEEGEEDPSRLGRIRQKQVNGRAWREREGEIERGGERTCW